MESSGTRNSILDWLLAATLAIAVISGLAGIDVDLGGLSLRSHSAFRVLVVAGVLLAARVWRGVSVPAQWVFRIALFTVIAVSVATWFRFLLTTVGGADSYGYVSASRLLRSGHLVEPQPIAALLSAPNAMAIASPLGWAPSPDASGIVPAYPLGLPALMAVFSLSSANGVFFVAPAAGLMTLWLTYRVTRAWYDAETALFAAALVAWNPLIIAYAKQPMSDVPATMWIMLGLWLALRPSRASAVGSGLAAGAALLTRPALVIAAVVIPVVAHRGDSPRRRAVLSAAGLAVGIAMQMLIQQQLFGSPLTTGYGTTAALFSWEHLPANLRIFAAHGWTVTGPLWLVGLILGLIAARPEPRSKPALIFAAVAVPYLFYLPFDHWETLRYLLPGIVPLTVLAADGLIHIARWPRHRVATTAIACAFLALNVGLAERLLRRSSVWEVASLEARYPLAGEWININTPPDSVVLANQHSGSLRWYARRPTLRWDFIAPDALPHTIAELHSHGKTAYVALEGAEVEMFEQRFAAVLDQLTIDHVGRIGNVQFRRLLPVQVIQR
jgi:hypothetical protein